MVALDIDGTLVDPYENVSPEVHAAVHRALDARVHVVLSTGRSVYGIGRLLDALDLDDGIAVASNGAVTFTYAPIDIRSAVTFDPRQAVQLLLERVPDALVAVEATASTGTFPRARSPARCGCNRSTNWSPIP
jgi:HAD superfamily hydrolase (TIGR01484 family)